MSRTSHSAPNDSDKALAFEQQIIAADALLDAFLERSRGRQTFPKHEVVDMLLDVKARLRPTLVEAPK